MALSGKLAISTFLTYTAALDLATVQAPLNYNAVANLTSGTGVNQATKLFSDTRTLAPSGAEDLDLAGVLTDAFGAALTFTAVKGVIIAAAAANSNLVVVGGAASNGFVNWVADPTDKINVRPGGAFALFAPDATGYVVTAGTGDLLHVANSGAGTSVTYDVIILGI